MSCQLHIPETKHIYQDFQELQRKLNDRVNLKLSNVEEASDALKAEQRLRFEEDEVPEMASPPPDWNRSFLQHKWKLPGQPVPSTEEVLESFSDFVNPPLQEDELVILREHCMRLCDSVISGRLASEFTAEKARIETFLKSNECVLETYQFFKDPEFGEERVSIITRHFLKRRWQSMGLWLESWGIPGRYYQWSTERDDFSGWSAAWHGSFRGLNDGAAKHFVNKLLEHRATSLRGQMPSINQHKVLGGTGRRTPWTAWSFITSRPWFLWEVEKAEEQIRFRRLPRQVREMFDSSSDDPNDLKCLQNRVSKLWRDRGRGFEDWRQPPGNESVIPGWWWPVEGQPCEEEDLSVLNNTEYLAHHTTVSRPVYTSSECDALERMSPSNVTPSERHETYLEFEDKEDAAYTESKAMSTAIVERYNEEAHQYADPFARLPSLQVVSQEWQEYLPYDAVDYDSDEMSSVEMDESIFTNPDPFAAQDSKAATCSSSSAGDWLDEAISPRSTSTPLPQPATTVSCQGQSSETATAGDGTAPSEETGGPETGGSENLVACIEDSSRQPSPVQAEQRTVSASSKALRQSGRSSLHRAHMRTVLGKRKREETSDTSDEELCAPLALRSMSSIARHLAKRQKRECNVLSQAGSEQTLSPEEVNSVIKRAKGPRQSNPLRKGHAPALCHDISESDSPEYEADDEKPSKMPEPVVAPKSSTVPRQVCEPVVEAEMETQEIYSNQSPEIHITPAGTEVQKTETTAVEALKKPEVLGSIWHGVKKQKAKKYPAKSFVEASERASSVGSSTEVPRQMDSSAVLGPVKKARVTKRVSKKAEHTGPLRRSTRAAALQATAKLAKMQW